MDSETTVDQLQERERESGTTLASSVYSRLRSDILAGTLEPGEKLRAEFLRDRYQVGNSPVREALNRLSADGLVVREDQKGFRVSAVSEEELAELTKTRCWLEAKALRESIEAGTVEWEEGLVLAFHRLSKVNRSSDDATYVPNPEWERLHRAFHLALIAGCGSRFLIGFCAQLNDQADRYRQLAVRTIYPKRHERVEHKAIVDAAIARDSDKAVTLLLDHYRLTERIILEAKADLFRE